MSEGLKWAKIPITISEKDVFLKVFAIAYPRSRKTFLHILLGHMDIINVWLMPFHKMGQKWAQNPAYYLYQTK